MKGILKKTKEGWFVEYKVEERTPVGHKSWWETIPVHQETFDPNIKQPIVTLIDGKEVEFGIVISALDFTSYAQLTNTGSTYEKMKSEDTIPDEYPELEGTINLCDDINNKVVLPYNEILNHLIDKMEEISQEQIDKDSFQLGRYRTFKYIFDYIQSFKKD